MIVTARQLEDLHRSHGLNGHVTLPYRARLTPLASDYVRAKKIALGYSDTPAPTNGTNTPTTDQPLAASRIDAAATSTTPAPTAQGAFLWWCDGPCGPAKAAIVGEEKQANLRTLNTPPDAKQIVQAIKSLAAEVKANRAAGGILLVQNGALAMVFANRCPSLRAVLGTSLEAVEAGVRQVAANVLVIETPNKALPQVRNLLSRFLRASRTLAEDVRRQIEELASCG